MSTINEVATIAHDTVTCVMLAGLERHGNAWLTRTDADDLSHILDHLRLYAAGNTDEPHLSHALTRLAMMLTRQRARQ